MIRRTFFRRLAAGVAAVYASPEIMEHLPGLLRAAEPVPVRALSSSELGALLHEIYAPLITEHVMAANPIAGFVERVGSVPFVAGNYDLKGTRLVYHRKIRP